MFKHILVPTDFTEKSLRAIEIAMQMGLQDISKVTLLHVIETIEGAEGDEFTEFYERLRTHSQERLTELVKRFVSRDLLIQTEILYGNRANEIVRFAHENDIDLIVLSSHRIDAGSEALGFGTISYKVGILAHCPVMMVK
jgi:nucleotide-binding universal stress UspA family protein